MKRRPTDEILSPLPQPFRSALLSMYNVEPQLGSDGERHSLDGKTLIAPEQGMWLYSLCRGMKPHATLEIGLAYGFSTSYFLAAIHENGAGHHTAIDPLQARLWDGIGRQGPQNLDMGASFRFMEAKSASALVRLADCGETFEVIFIDGNHRFDEVLVDFTLSARLCPVGGCIVLDDLWMSSIRRAVAFIRSNRQDFEELKTPRNIVAFRRLREDARAWHHYVNFFGPSDVLRAILRLEFFDTTDVLRKTIRHTPISVRRVAKAILRFVRP